MSENMLPNHYRSQVPAYRQVAVGFQSEGFGGLLNPPFIEAGLSFTSRSGVVRSGGNSTPPSLKLLADRGNPVVAFRSARPRAGVVGGVPIDEVAEVSNYVAALEYAISQPSDPAGLPLCNRLVRNAHAMLLKGGRGAQQMPGEFRVTQNWVGGSRPGNAAFVPTPPV